MRVQLHVYGCNIIFRQGHQQHCTHCWVLHSDDDEDEEILSDGDVNSPAVVAAKPVARPRNPAASKAKAKPPAAPVAGQCSLP